jgi:hypothetical protein
MKTKNKNQSRAKFKRVEVHFTDSEKQLISEVATSSHVSVAAFIRHCALLQAKFALAGKNDKPDSSFSSEKVGAVAKRVLTNYSSTNKLGT